MATTSDQLERDLKENGNPHSTNAARRGMWNWFGVAFGIIVFIGASILYLSVRSNPGTDVAETVTSLAPTVAPPARQGADEEPAEAGPTEEVPGVAAPMVEALAGLYVVSSLETHELESIYANASEIDESDAAQMVQVLAALDAVEWPDELSEFVAVLRAEVAEFLAALEAGDLEEVRHSVEAMHRSQHDLSSGVYAWLSGTPMAAHEEDQAAPTTDVVQSEVIEIEMFEFGYTPETIDIEAGVPVVFRFTNTGRLAHEAMVGDAHMQEDFAAAGDHDDGQGEGDHHGDLMATLVQPGETQDLEVLIDEPGTWYVACHLVGHYEQGQIATINVRG